MEQNSLVEKYNTVYTAEPEAFGKPLEMVVEAAMSLKRGRALDLGAGTGRHALFLGRLGFTVTALDMSDVGVKMINDIAIAEGLGVYAEAGDMCTVRFGGEYQLAVLSFVLHHLGKEDAGALIQKVKNHISPSGMCVIGTFCDEGDLYEISRERRTFYVKPEEIEALFNGWKVVRRKVVSRRIHQKKLDGSPMFNQCLMFVAKRP